MAESLDEKIMAWMQKESIMPALSILNRSVLAYTDVPSEELLRIMNDGLSRLVSDGELKVLYPAGVNPEMASLSQTYYVLAEKTC